MGSGSEVAEIDNNELLTMPQEISKEAVSEPTFLRLQTDESHYGTLPVNQCLPARRTGPVH